MFSDQDCLLLRTQHVCASMDLQKITINSFETYNTIHATHQLNQDRTLNYKKMIR
jgi:hypothetical protein